MIPTGYYFLMCFQHLLNNLQLLWTPYITLAGGVQLMLSVSQIGLTDYQKWHRWYSEFRSQSTPVYPQGILTSEQETHFSMTLKLYFSMTPLLTKSRWKYSRCIETTCWMDLDLLVGVPPHLPGCLSWLWWWRLQVSPSLSSSLLQPAHKGQEQWAMFSGSSQFEIVAPTWSWNKHAQSIYKLGVIQLLLLVRGGSQPHVAWPTSCSVWYVQSGGRPLWTAAM